ncbi:MAG: carbohydrate ABC transporter permease [Tepidisphaeraceae bacterium]
MSTVITGITRAPAGGPGPLHPPGTTDSDIPLRAPRNVWARTRLYAVLMLLMAPSLLSLLLFTYYPQFGAIKYSFYNWDGTNLRVEWVGLKNFIEAFTVDPLFWQSFKLVLILLAANVVKMIPSIFTAIILHRVRSERWQYLYRVLFVVPMIIPSIVGLLIWKSFFDAGTGVLNAFLNATHLMTVLKHLDYAMAYIAATAPATAVREQFVIGGVSGLWWLTWLGLLLFAVRPIAKKIGVRSAARWNFLPWMAFSLLMLTLVVSLLTCVWPSQPIRAFDDGTPAWLGNENLIVPSLIFWGFPWIGTIGILLYLAGLQNISADVYEAADLDGVGSIRKLFAIELPLILTQVRINLIFLTISTITDYQFFLLLLGPDGGPGNKGMVPGLYMYQSAFIENRYGYACALGMILAVILLGITIVYQKYVTIDK